MTLLINHHLIDGTSTLDNESEELNWGQLECRLDMQAQSCRLVLPSILAVVSDELTAEMAHLPKEHARL